MVPSERALPHHTYTHTHAHIHTHTHAYKQTYSYTHTGNEVPSARALPQDKEEEIKRLYEKLDNNSEKENSETESVGIRQRRRK